MKQFTSHIDFSLTKKRFEMMVKNYSPFRDLSKKMLLIPLLITITLVFCTTQVDDIRYVFTIDNKDLYSDVELYMDQNRLKELNLENRGFGIQFDKATELPFSGTQITRYIENDKLFSKQLFEDGALISSTRFDADENVKNRTEYDYIGDTYTITRQFNEDGILILEITGPESDINPGILKEWYPSGQIKFEMTFHSGMQYHGLMTLYDENGEILEQELYEDGELVEKIK